MRRSDAEEVSKGLAFFGSTHCDLCMLLVLFRGFTLLLLALLTGLAFAHLLEMPAKLHYEGAFYVAIQKSLYEQWGPPNVGGILEPATILATGLLAFLGRKTKRGLWVPFAAVVALLLAFPVVFFVLVAPANAEFQSIALPTLPNNWEALRTQWELGHGIRFGLQFAALSLLIFGLSMDALDGLGHRGRSTQVDVLGKR